ncbi:hypothetical protein RRF57_000385 [Xylaria bambusicola]|uniref:Uncharacterized protein n=1 Tax=Xylaria bambusicola TaxID=326684 RepID=A0AAN7U9R6_9PEZI
MRLYVDAKHRCATPVLLTLALSVAILPGIRGETEDDGLVTKLLNNRLDGNSLLADTRDSQAESLSSVGPTSLHDTSFLASANVIDDV